MQTANVPPVVLTKDVQARLQGLGINSLHSPGSVAFPGSSILEAPCSLKWLIPDVSFELGAFSYAVSGYFFATSIQRYCSIGEQVQVGRHSHPLDFGSTSPLFYQAIDSVIGTLNHSSVEKASFKATRPPTVLKTTTIKNDVYIGHGAFILPGVTIGNGAVIGAMSVVTKDVPDYAIVAGSPARVVRQRFDDKLVEALLKSQWWRFSPQQLSGIDIADPSQLVSKVYELESRGVLPYAPLRIRLHELVLDGKL
ncbi:MAG: CatB-related O-acetyltransferase [Cyanobacteriota bacterium]|jgi:acetyltransferase-like isoleucine patch superfamily enzyme